MSEYIINEQEEDALQTGSSLSLRAILEMTWALRYWIILSIFVCLCFASVYLYVKPKTYHSAALVMVTTDKNAGMGSSAQMSFIADMTGMQNYNSLTNEKIIIKSTPVLQAVVEELGLNVRYYVRNHWVNRETLPQEVRMTFTGGDSINLNNLPTFRINYEVIDTTSLRINVRRRASARRMGNRPVPFLGGGQVAFQGRIVRLFHVRLALHHALFSPDEGARTVQTDWR